MKHWIITIIVAVVISICMHVYKIQLKFSILKETEPVVEMWLGQGT